VLFGRAQEEIEALEAAGIRFEVVPGVTAALAACAELGISLTQRGLVRSVAFVTPRVGDGKTQNTWVESVAAADSGAIYMGTGEAEAISAALIAAGKSPSTPIAVVENASLLESRIIFSTLGALPRLAGQSMSGPAVIFLGPQFRARARAALFADERTSATARSGR